MFQKGVHTIQKFINDPLKFRGAKTLIQGRGMECDWVRDFNDNPLNIGKTAELATLNDDKEGIDVFIKKWISGEKIDKIQMKTAMSETGAKVNLSKYLR